MLHHNYITYNSANLFYFIKRHLLDIRRFYKSREEVDFQMPLGIVRGRHSGRFLGEPRANPGEIWTLRSCTSSWRKVCGQGYQSLGFPAHFAGLWPQKALYPFPQTNQTISNPLNDYSRFLGPQLKDCMSNVLFKTKRLKQRTCAFKKKSLNISVGRKSNSQRKLWAVFLSGHLQLYIRSIIVIIQLISQWIWTARWRVSPELLQMSVPPLLITADLYAVWWRGKPEHPEETASSQSFVVTSEVISMNIHLINI